MEKKILKFKRLLRGLIISQCLQTLHAIRKDVESLIIMIPALQPAFATFATALSNLSGFFKKNPKAFETEDIVKKDVERDFTVRAVTGKVQYHYDFAFTEDEKQQARRLMHVVEKYKGAATKDYETETVYLRSMVNELQQMPDLLDNFGIADLVARLKCENEDFEQFYNARAQIVHDKQLKGNASKYRLEANNAFDNLCKVITGLLYMPLSEEEKTTIDSIVDIINAHIRQATVIYNRHAGIVASKKKDNEEIDDAYNDASDDE